MSSGRGDVFLGWGLPSVGDSEKVLEEAVQAIRDGCGAYPTLGAEAQLARTRQLVSAGAWTEAALALVKLQAPDWTVRRIEIDDGVWFCALSRRPAVPSDFDERVEASHRLLPLSILEALARALELAQAAPDPLPSSLSQRSGEPAWVDNCR
ncbi:MAG: hypothetical protein P4M09_29240 [Devosia sp.]|nr:hypothetical protein [Devosia sp.]